jgi:uncharacterized protein YyaL (SSP411 family)
MAEKNSNELIHESSPYLLQHAHNPVNWFPWTDAAWEKAKSENKLVIISIGYSSCHWCHVMEHQTFEDEAAAKIMNDHFISIKVDREERPDVDHVYMSAVQLMTGQGGWPLNCICLPDGRPIYGGTYFPNEQWKSILLQLYDFYTKNKQKAEEYAEELIKGVQQMEFAEKNKDEISFSKDTLKLAVQNWKNIFDNIEGGPSRAPKFPMPNNLEFLLQYAVAEKDDEVLKYVTLTLDKMAFGGIYDHVGGGFARYSTDTKWKVPHFEKMLYDNAQLITVYANAYKLTQKKIYKDVVTETLDFIEREMMHPAYGFYAALDADSEGVEGKFYVWTKEEFEDIAPKENYKIIKEYFNINEKGFWEHGNYILLRAKTDEEIATEYSLSTDELEKIISGVKKILLKKRSERVRPALDDKQLTSWNSLMISGYCDAYEATGEERFLQTARKKMEFVLRNLAREDGGLFHSYKNGKAGINGFLEDYSFTIEALIKVYEATFEEKFLSEAKRLANYALKHFLEPESGMFFFTSNMDPELIARKKEIHDNVIPASNSSIAKGFFKLGKFFNEEKYIKVSRQMLNNVQKDIPRYGSSFSNWSILLMWNLYPFYEIVMTGEDVAVTRSGFVKNYLPAKILAGSADADALLPLLKERWVKGKTLIYVCENNTCRLPVEKIEDAISSMN